MNYLLRRQHLDKVEKQLITLRNEADSQASDGDEN